MNSKKLGWEPETKRELRLATDGTWYSVTETRKPVDPSPIFNELIQNSGFMLPLLSPDNYAYAKHGKLTYMRVLREIPFRMNMRLDHNSTEPRFVPAFGGEGINVDPPFMYVPPEDMLLVFVCATREFPINISNSSVFLLAVHAETESCYHPLLPNTYDNGRLCLGHAIDRAASFSPSLGLDGCLNQLLKMWSETEWNGDLVNINGNRTTDWLSFDESTMRNNVPAEPHWVQFTSGPIVPPPEIETAIVSLIDVLRPTQTL